MCMCMTSAVFYSLHWDNEPLKLNSDDKVRTANASKENNVVVAPHTPAVSLPDPALTNSFNFPCQTQSRLM